MTSFWNGRAVTVVTLLGSGALIATLGITQAVDAADHTDPPRVTAGDGDAAGDIADFYAWHHEADGSTRMVFALTFAGLGAPGEPATYDPDVLYGIHVDNDGDHEADVDLWVRFAQDGAGDWGVQLSGVPGSDPVEGATGGMIEDGSVSLYAGLREDPFFFDLDGFMATLSTGDLAFDPENDTFAGTNVTAIAIEIDADSVLATDGTALQTWATTARIGGGA